MHCGNGLCAIADDCVAFALDAVEVAFGFETWPSVFAEGVVLDGAESAQAGGLGVVTSRVIDDSACVAAVLGKLLDGD